MLLHLLRHRAGSATIEFALWLSLFFMAFLPVIDFASYHVQQRQLTQAIASAQVSAFTNASAVSFTAIPALIQSTTSIGTVTVAVTCNGTQACVNTGRVCSCLTRTGTYVATTCGATCTASNTSSGSVGGYYLTISASAPFRTLVVPNKYLDGTTVTASSTVRLQ